LTPEEQFEEWLSYQSLDGKQPSSVGLLIYLNRSQARMEALLEKGMEASMVLSPDSLTEIVKHSKQARTNYMCWGIAFLAPPGVTTNLDFTIPDGWYSTDREKHVYSTFYDPGVVMNVFCDQHLVTPIGVVLTAPAEITFGEYWDKAPRSLVRYQVVNTTVTPATITISGWTELLEKTFFEKVYRPMIEQMFTRMTELLNRTWPPRRQSE